MKFQTLEQLDLCPTHNITPLLCVVSVLFLSSHATFLWHLFVALTALHGAFCFHPRSLTTRRRSQRDDQKTRDTKRQDKWQREDGRQDTTTTNHPHIPTPTRPPTNTNTNAHRPRTEEPKDQGAEGLEDPASLLACGTFLHTYRSLYTPCALSFQVAVSLFLVCSLQYFDHLRRKHAFLSNATIISLATLGTPCLVHATCVFMLVVLLVGLIMALHRSRNVGLRGALVARRPQICSRRGGSDDEDHVFHIQECTFERTGEPKVDALVLVLRILENDVEVVNLMPQERISKPIYEPSLEEQLSERFFEQTVDVFFPTNCQLHASTKMVLQLMPLAKIPRVIASNFSLLFLICCGVGVFLLSGTIQKLTFWCALTLCATVVWQLC